MAPLTSIPADQRAVLQLVLQQRRSYQDLAGLLGIDPGAVRERALSACDALGPEAGGRLAPERRGEVVDFLLGQQSDSQRERTRAYLAASGDGRAWALGVAGELRPLNGDLGADIPTEAAAREPVREAEPITEDTPVLSPPRRERERERRPRREPMSRPRREPPSRRPRLEGAARPSSRLGGGILLVVAGVVLAVVLVILLTGGDDDGKQPTATTPANTTTTAAQPVAQVNLKQPGGGKAIGVAQIIRQGDKLGMGIAAQELPATTNTRFYAVWLYNTRSDVAFLGFAPPVTASGQAKGRLSAFAQTLPDNYRRYRDVVVALQTVDLSQSDQAAPKSPGPIFLRGPFTQAGG